MISVSIILRFFVFCYTASHTAMFFRFLAWVDLLSFEIFQPKHQLCRLRIILKCRADT